MGKGRKQIPNQIKDLKGTYQKCRDKDIPHLPPVNKLPSPPTMLNKHGKRVYREIGQHLLDVKILNEINLMMFTALCREYGIYWEAEEDMKKLSDRWETAKDKNGNSRTVPTAKHKISKEALQNAKMLSTEFGLTPASVMKITAPLKKDKPGIEDLLK